MRFFELRDFQLWIMGLFLATVAVIVIYLAFSSYGSSMAGKKSGGKEEELVEYPEGLKIANNPVPAFVIFILIGVFVWAFFYFLWVWKGAPF